MGGIGAGTGIFFKNDETDPGPQDCDDCQPRPRRGLPRIVIQKPLDCQTCSS